MLGTITKTEYKNNPLPENVYLAKLLNVKEKEASFKKEDGQLIKYTKLTWAFEIIVDPFKKRRAWGKTPSNWIAGKKLDTWLQTLGLNVATGTSIKIEDLKDMYIKIHVKEKPYKDTETGEEKSFPEVISLLPLDSLDQIKIREYMSGLTATATQTNVAPAPAAPVQPAYIPTTPVFSQPNVQAGGFVPVTTSAPTVPGIANPPAVNPLGNGNTTVSTAPSTPSRTIPF